MLERRDTGNEGCRKVGCMTGGIQERRDPIKEMMDARFQRVTDHNDAFRPS